MPDWHEVRQGWRQPLPPHPEAGAAGRCGATFTGATGIQWVCIAQVHATADDVKADRPRIYRHYMVRRWPHRDQHTN